MNEKWLETTHEPLTKLENSGIDTRGIRKSQAEVLMTTYEPYTMDYKRRYEIIEPQSAVYW